MAQNRPYVYDPSQQIRKDLSNAAMTLEQGFQNVLDRKKQEYDFVNKVYQDTELMKKDLNIHNYELITKRSNDLIKETASAIKEKGKVDFKKLGELRQKVSSIADAKRNSELAVQALGEVAKMAQANAANMRNPVETITKMMSKLKDENYLFSPRNMYEVAMEDYKDGLDYSKIIGEKVQELQKRGTPVQGFYDEKDGSQIKYKGVVPFGFRLNPDTKKLEPADEIDPKTGVKTDKLGEIINTIDPELWNGYMKQTVGFGQMFNPNKDDFARDFINNALTGSISYETNKDAIQRGLEINKFQQSEEDLKTAQRKNTPEAIAAEEEDRRLNIDYKKAQISNMAADNALAQKNYLQRVKEFNYQVEQDKKTPNRNPGDIRFSKTGNSFFTDVKFGTKKIVAIKNSLKGGIELEDTNKKVIYLSTQPEIDAFYNTLKKETREAIDIMTSSPQYVPAKDSKTKTSVSTKKPKPY